MDQLNDKDLEGYLEARRFAKDLGSEIASKIRTGMTERDIEKVANEVFSASGVKEHWHMPVIGVGEGTTKLRNAFSMAAGFLKRYKRTLEENDLVLIDIAPVYNDYPADYTTMHISGTNDELASLVEYSRKVSRRIAEHVTKGMAVSDIFIWADELIRKESSYTLALPPFISMGHRLCSIPGSWKKLPEPGLTYLVLGKRGSFISKNNKNLMEGLWVIEPYLIHNGRGAKFEELILVGEETFIPDAD